MAKLTEIKAKEKYLSINWQVNNFCNYSCTYCNPGNYIGDSPNLGNLETYIQNLDIIITKYEQQNYRHFKFFFSGGEPTAWKNFIPIAEWMRERIPDSTIAVNTNLSRPLAWWEKYHYLFDDIVASFHVEHADKDKYLEKSLYLCDKVNYLASKMLMHDERFWEVVEYGELLKQILPNYFIEWTPLFDEISTNAGPWNYTDPEKSEFLKLHSSEHLQTVDKPWRPTPCISHAVWDDGTEDVCNSNDIIVKDANFFEGWECTIGDAVFINQIGNVSMGSCGQAGMVGNILSDVSQVGPKQLICAKSHCTCGTDIIIPKRDISVC